MIENYIREYCKTTNDIDKKLDMLYNLVISCPFNLTSIKDEKDFAYKHVLDSIYWFTQNTPACLSIADIGSGGGFPGLVLAIFYPDKKITLVDSIGKKCKFLEDTATALGLENVSVINARAEAIQKQNFDLITARGVGTVKEVLKLTEHLAKPGGEWLMYKGEKLNAELEQAVGDIKSRGLKIETVRIEKPFTRTYLYLHH